MSLLSAALGLDSSHNAGVAEKNATDQLKLQNQYGQQAAGVYAGLNQQGVNAAGAYQGNYLQLLNEFGGLAGLGSPITQTRQPGAPNVPGQAPTQGGLAATLNNRAPGPLNQPQGQGVAAPGQQDQGQAANPYQLDQNQQQLLNQSMAQIGQSAHSATQQFRQQMEASGITDPRALEAGSQQIDEHFTALAQTTQAQFYEQIKADKLKALQEIMSGLQGYGQQGISEQESAGSGYLGLSSGAQAAANAQQSAALQQQQLSNEQLGGALQLAAFGFGGGFGGGGAGVGSTSDLGFLSIGTNPANQALE